MLTCQAVVELVTDYLEDALPTRDRASFETHLATCAECSVYVDQIRQTIHAVHKVGQDLPIPSCDDLVEAFGDYGGSGG